MRGGDGVLRQFFLAGKSTLICKNDFAFHAVTARDPAGFAGLTQILEL
jgi:hypothetical protein